MTSPEWRRIADEIAWNIDRGIYGVGTWLTVPKLRIDHARPGAGPVGVKTIQTALIVLEDRGMVEPQHGVGYRVLGPATRPVSPAPQ